VACRTDRVTLVDTYQYNDSAEDVFQREPYCVNFRLHGTGVSTQKTCDFVSFPIFCNKCITVLNKQQKFV